MFKYLHTMVRVANLEKSLHFYCQGLGFEVVKKDDYEKDRFSLVFLRAAPGGQDEPMIELTHNWDTDQYDKGSGFGHVAYQVESIEQVRKRLMEAGYDLSWGPGMTPNGKRKMAFVDDPDGYEIELLEG
jgi:lactoylglutathione lyase